MSVHELGLATAVVNAVQVRAQGRPVAKVRLHVGLLHHVHPGSFEQSFEIAAMGTEVEGALAEVVYEDVKVFCESCGACSEADGLALVCPNCGSSSLRLLAGDELVLESVEYRTL
jgi:hydrogenase nickel incorporation protein HypA/HybF